MVRSMTGFGNSFYDDEIYHLSIEIKSVNNRYCDIQLRLPNNLRYLEQEIYQQIKAHRYRGKIEVSIKFRYTPEVNNGLTVDKSLLIAYYNTLKSIRTTILEVDPQQDIKDITFMDLLKEPGIIIFDENKLDSEQTSIIVKNTLEQALSKFNEAKISEGKVLQEDISNRVDKIKEYLEMVKDLSPLRLKIYKQHLLNVVEELSQNVDCDYKEQRLMQEVALMADKLDITEELTRFVSHIQQFHNIFQQAEGIGRSLDFLIQEMNREANTIASKANHSKIAHLVVAIKGELEKIREQIQNIE